MSAEHFDALETRDPGERERDLAGRLPALLQAALRAPGWRRHLGAVDARAIDSRAALARLPVLRKSELIGLQRSDPPLAGFDPAPPSACGRMFASPGPIYESETRNEDAWRAARALFAAGLRRGDLVLNTFSYHWTPGGFILDSGARALGCTVIPAGPGNTPQQLDAIEHLRPNAYCGTPDYLKIVLDAAQAGGRGASSLRKASVSGAAFPASLQSELRARGIEAYQCYATADVGIVAYESPAREGLIVNEDVLLEIVRPGSGEPLADGEVGEVVVTSFDPDRPWIRLALGDLSAISAGRSSCGRTNVRIRGWLGRADQTAKVKGMFVRPEQIARIAAAHPGLGRLRLVVTRSGETDAMTLYAESASPDAALARAIEATLHESTRLSGQVQLVAPQALPNDGKVIEDRRALPS
jgi:phenylacetate-CoA ligase